MNVSVSLSLLVDNRDLVLDIEMYHLHKVWLLARLEAKLCSVQDSLWASLGLEAHKVRSCETCVWINNKCLACATDSTTCEHRISCWAIWRIELVDLGIGVMYGSLQMIEVVWASQA